MLPALGAHAIRLGSAWVTASQLSTTTQGTPWIVLRSVRPTSRRDRSTTTWIA